MALLRGIVEDSATSPLFHLVYLLVYLNCNELLNPESSTLYALACQNLYSDGALTPLVKS